MLYQHVEYDILNTSKSPVGIVAFLPVGQRKRYIYCVGIMNDHHVEADQRTVGLNDGQCDGVGGWIGWYLETE